MKKINIKTIYLVAVISIGLIGLAIGSTYAIFTTSAEINNPITINSNLTSDNDVMETIEVEIEPYKTVTKTIIVNINSDNLTNVNYGIWYLNNITDVDIGILSTNSRITGLIKNSNDSATNNIVLRNNSSTKKTVILGVSTSKNSIVLASNMKLVPKTVIGERTINTNAATYITKLYSTTEKESIINNSITYNTSPSQLLMNDRKGSTSTSIDAGNLRYYGADPDNYVYFNCSDYTNPTSSTCETWRIIGVFDGKVKIIRDESIGSYSWDSSTDDTTNGTNVWEESQLMRLLNGGYSGTGGSLYWNAKSGSCYNNMEESTTSCSFTSTGIKNDTTRNMISETTYNLGVFSGTYPNAIYTSERGTTVSGSNPTTWTGKIGLMYLSDYGYAADLSKCNQTLNNYSNSTCTSNNYLYKELGEWTINYSSGRRGRIVNIGTDGSYTVDYAYEVSDIRPVLYLNPDTIITKGEGTKTQPYKITTTNLAATVTSLYESSSKTSVTNGGTTYQYDISHNLMKDASGNIRYFGSSPNNYIYFNCSNYSSQSSSTCETWRIIGYIDGKVKLMRGSDIGTYSWDNKNTSTGAGTKYGQNNWANARIMKLLNPSTYYSVDSFDNGYGQSLYWNSQSGTCFAEASEESIGTNATKSCSFTSTGIKNDITRNLISESKWYLGGSTNYSIYSAGMYNLERGTTVYTGRPTTWNGKIGLAYPSDYGYAADFRSCTQDLDNYNNSSCTSNNWMKSIIEPNCIWFITHYNDVSYSVWRACVSRGVGYNTASYTYGIIPVLYLDPKLAIKSGTGTSSSPYQLSVS